MKIHPILLPLVAALALPTLASRAAEALPSWNEGRSKPAIVTFVEKVSQPGSADFVPPADRIAVFDNDGTLWGEQPVYAQLAFALAQVKALAPDHPEWKEKEPFRSLLSTSRNDKVPVTEKQLLDLVMATHAGQTTDEFARRVETWLATATHPTTGRKYTAMVYQPMLELLAYLRAHGFKTFIVSGGGVEFMRVFAEAVYGIPPEQVIGSTIRTQYEVRNGQPVLVRLPEIDFIDDKAGKPVGIQRHIGRRPLLACGNSDGDFQMLEWTTRGPGPRLGLMVHHTDAAREWAYDRKSQVGRLDRGLDEAPQQGWTVIDMKADWNRIYPGE